MAKTRVVSQDIGDASVLPADLDVSADNTTADATTGHHGLVPKLGGGTTNYLRADGSWNAPPGTGGSGAPSTVDYLVGTADGGLSAEIVVGTTPGGELGGTWGTPTVDAAHGGSAHALIDVSAGSTTSLQTFSDTDMAIAVAASTNYRIFCMIFFNTNAVGVGIRLAFNGPASPTLIKVGGFVATGGGGANDSTIGHTSVTAYDTTIVTTTTGPGATNAVAILSGIFQNGSNAGTLTVRHASETSTLTTIEAGSYLELQKF